MAKRASILLAALAFLAGCGSEEAPSPGGGGGGDKPATTQQDDGGYGY
jgi:hypothetical protein